MIFAGIQDGRVALIVRGLVADSAGNISVERFEGIAPSYTRTGFFLGLNGHIRSYVKAHPDWVKEDLAKTAYQFVEMEIAARPNLAGPPISEREMDNEGKSSLASPGRMCLKPSELVCAVPGHRAGEQDYVTGCQKRVGALVYGVYLLFAQEWRNPGQFVTVLTRTGMDWLIHLWRDVESASYMGPSHGRTYRNFWSIADDTGVEHNAGRQK